MLAKSFFCFAVLLACVQCSYPTGAEITKDFREITISYNASTKPANFLNHNFEVKLANPPSYSVPFTQHITTASNHSVINIKNLLIDEVIKYRVRTVINGTNATEADYSPYYEVFVLNASQAVVSVIPGKPLNMKVEKNPDGSSTHSVIVTWDDPTNIQQATEGSNDKDIQYQLDICPYNRYEPTKREGCQTEAKMLRTKGTNKQTTESGKSTPFYGFNFHPDKENELVYILTPIALNGTKGETTETLKRIDNTTAPKAPTNVNGSDIYANEVSIQWDSSVSNAKAYIQISTLNMLVETRQATSNPFEVTGLKNGTEYEFKVGVYTSKNGGSELSTKYVVSTTNEKKPTPAPSNSGNLLTSSPIIIMIASAIFVFKLW